MGRCSLQSSLFLMIDDNTIKESIKLHEFSNLTTYTCLDAYQQLMSAWSSPKSMISPLFLPLFAIPSSYVVLIHLSFLPFWKTLPLLWKILAYDPLDNLVLIQTSPLLKSNHLKDLAKTICSKRKVSSLES